jgi:hypothetical protein
MDRKNVPDFLLLIYCWRLLLLLLQKKYAKKQYEFVEHPVAG